MLKLIVGLVFGTTILMAYALGQVLAGSQALISERLAQVKSGFVPQTAEETLLQQSLRERLLRPLTAKFAGAIGRLTPRGLLAKIQHSLTQAGNPFKLSATEFVGVVCLGAGFLSSLVCVYALLAGLAPAQTIVCTLGTGLLSVIMSILVVRRKIWERQQSILRNLPDTLDLLTVSVEAGLGFDAALVKVVKKSKGPLAEEFARTLHEMQVGKLRRDALRDMSERLNVADFTAFAGAIIQADQLGVSIGNVLRIQAEQMRQRRRQHAEESAMKAPVKMLFPMIFFIFPTIFIVLLGPAALQLIEMFSNM